MAYFEEITFNKNHHPDSLLGSEFIDCTFHGLDLTEEDLSHSKFIDCRFESINLSNAKLLSCTFRDCSFVNCKLIGVNWSNTYAISLIKFSSSVLDFSIFNELNMSNSHFDKCKMHEIDFFGTNLKGSEFLECDLLKTSFNEANLANSDLRGSIQYCIDHKFTNIKGAKLSLPEALTLFKSLEVEVS